MELVIALILVSVTSAIMMPAAWRWTDRWRVGRAAAEVSAFYHVARQSAMLHAGDIRVVFGSDSLLAVLEGPPDSVVVALPGPARLGVTLTASRSIIGIDANGLGWGAANTTVVLRKGVAAESLTTSRLGRLKRW